MNIEKILREVPTTEKIFRSSKRVGVFRAGDCIMALSKHNMQAQDIKIELQSLLDSYKIFKVKMSEKNPNNVDLAMGRVPSASDYYIWAEEKTNHWNLAVGVLIIVLLFSLVMFQMWPIWLRRMVGYARYPLIAFMGFVFVLGVIRLVVYGITYFTHYPGLWIFPNLFEECGCFESFVPLYRWENLDDAHKEK